MDFPHKLNSLTESFRNDDLEHSPASTLQILQWYEPENDNEHHDLYAFA